MSTKTDYSNNTTTYTYDGLGRLTSETSSLAVLAGYEYDDFNNRVSMSETGGQDDILTTYVTTYVYVTIYVPVTTILK